MVGLQLDLEAANPIEIFWMLAEHNGRDLPECSVDRLSSF
jgi:hypothetical protein